MTLCFSIIKNVFIITFIFFTILFCVALLIRFPSFVFENLYDLHWMEVNIVISCILQSLKYAVANWMAAGPIKSFLFVKCFIMEIRIFLEYMYEVILLSLKIVIWWTSSFFSKSSNIKSIQWVPHGVKNNHFSLSHQQFHPCLIICRIISDYLHYSFPSNPLHNRIQHLKYLISSLGYIIGIYRW